MKKKIVYFVHCIDTEGPLFESLSAKFERIKDMFNIEIKKSWSNLEKLKRKKIPLKGLENKIAEVLSNHLTDYNYNWKKIDIMIKEIFSQDFRKKYLDSFKNSWVFNWHCLDHVGYKINPRRRTLGYHKIFDYYNSVLNKYKKQKFKDRIHWHFHPMSANKEAHRCATSYSMSPELYQILCRRIIDRNYFPSVFRAGFQAERPDSNMFLEQWIPFDMTNMSTKNTKDIDMSLDFKLGRSGDWRKAPKEWSIYHPHHDDYQSKGNCRRWIGRALNVMNRIATINQKDIDQGFLEAKKKGYALVGFASHDFRNLATEVKFLYNMIQKSSKKFRNIKFKFCEAGEAFQNLIKVLEKQKITKLKFGVKFYPGNNKDFPRISVEVKKGEVFGPQPFLAIKRKNNSYIHDNFDFSGNKKKWHYAFHADTISLSEVSKIAVAANDKFGNTYIKRFNVVKNQFLREIL